MVHRLFAPIVLAGIALGGCQRERGIARAETSATPAARDAGTGRKARASADGGPRDAIARARPRDAGPADRPGRQRKRPRVPEPLMIL